MPAGRPCSLSWKTPYGSGGAPRSILHCSNHRHAVNRRHSTSVRCGLDSAIRPHKPLIGQGIRPARAPPAWRKSAARCACPVSAARNGLGDLAELDASRVRKVPGRVFQRRAPSSRLASRAVTSAPSRLARLRRQQLVAPAASSSRGTVREQKLRRLSPVRPGSWRVPSARHARRQSRVARRQCVSAGAVRGAAQRRRFGREQPRRRPRGCNGR